MKNLRHHLGKNLRRLANRIDPSGRPTVRLGSITLSDPVRMTGDVFIKGADTGDAVHKMLLRLKRERGGGSLGLS